MLYPPCEFQEEISGSIDLNISKKQAPNEIHVLILPYLLYFCVKIHPFTQLPYSAERGESQELVIIFMIILI